MAEQFPDEFRLGGEAPDTVDGDWQMFVGDPHLRAQIREEEIRLIADAEAAADAIAQQHAQLMGLPTTHPRHLDDILARYDEEFGNN